MRPFIPALVPVYAALSEPVYALTRLTAGAFLVPHGLWKLFGITGSQQEMIAFFQAIGLEPAVPLMIFSVTPVLFPFGTGLAPHAFQFPGGMLTHNG